MQIWPLDVFSLHWLVNVVVTDLDWNGLYVIHGACHFPDPEIWQFLQKCRKRRSQPGVFEDVYDGEEYQRHASFLPLLANLSLICNTDGVAIFRSSKTSIWPVWLVINELPKSQRYVQAQTYLCIMIFWKYAECVGVEILACMHRPLLQLLCTIHVLQVVVLWVYLLCTFFIGFWRRTCCSLTCGSRGTSLWCPHIWDLL